MTFKKKIGKTMKYLLIILTGLWIQGGYCASGSPIGTGIEAEKNRIDLAQIHEGMDHCEVLKILGYPFKKERHKIDNQVYEIWFYLTKPVELGQTKLIDQNFTPLIFQNGILLGSGKLYYRHILDIDHGREKYEEGKKQTYTNDKDEWPQEGTHTILTPPKKGAQRLTQPALTPVSPPTPANPQIPQATEEKLEK